METRFPAIKHDLLDILEEKNIEINNDLLPETINVEGIKDKLNIIFQESLFNNIEEEGRKRDFLIYSAIYEGYNKIPLMSGFSKERASLIKHYEINNILRLGLLNNYIYKDRDFKFPKIDYYFLSEDGLGYLKEFIEKMLGEGTITENEVEELKKVKLIHEIEQIKNLKFSMDEKSF